MPTKQHPSIYTLPHQLEYGKIVGTTTYFPIYDSLGIDYEPKVLFLPFLPEETPKGVVPAVGFEIGYNSCGWNTYSFEQIIGKEPGEYYIKKMQDTLGPEWTPNTYFIQKHRQSYRLPFPSDAGPKNPYATDKWIQVRLYPNNSWENITVNDKATIQPALNELFDFLLKRYLNPRETGEETITGHLLLWSQNFYKISLHGGHHYLMPNKNGKMCHPVLNPATKLYYLPE